MKFPLLFCLFFVPALIWGQTGDNRGSGEITSYLAAGEFHEELHYVQVLLVKAAVKDGLWRFTVTLEHRDEILSDGTEHYADRIQIINPEDGSILAERVLLHSHINEMPLSRDVGAVSIPDGLRSVIVQASCTHHGSEGRKVLVPLLRY